MNIKVLSAIVQISGLLVEFEFYKQFTIIDADDDYFTVRALHGDGTGDHTDFYFNAETATFALEGSNNQTLVVSDVQGFSCHFHFREPIQNFLGAVQQKVGGDEMLKTMFFCLCNLPLDENRLRTAFMHWPAGTSLSDVCGWMDKQNFPASDMFRQHQVAEAETQAAAAQRAEEIDSHIDPTYDSNQRVVLRSYASGDMAHLPKIEMMDCGDTLLSFLLVELSMQEDCDSPMTAVQRLDTAIRQLTEVKTAFEKEAVGF